MSALLAAIAALAVTASPSSHEALASACLTGRDAELCLALSAKLESGALKPRYAEEALHWLVEACQRDSAVACDRAESSAGSYPDYEDLEGDAGCMLEGNAFACEELAQSIVQESERKALPRARLRMHRALALYRAACARGEAESCLGASRVLGQSFAVHRDLEASRAFAMKACDLGLGRACRELAEGSKSAERQTLLLRACSLPPGDPHACLALHDLVAPRAREPAAAAKPPVLKDSVDWDRLAYVLSLVRDEYAEQAEISTATRAGPFLDLLAEARGLAQGAPAPGPGLAAEIGTLEGEVKSQAAPAAVSLHCIALLNVLRSTGKMERAPAHTPSIAHGEAAYRAMCSACHGALSARTLPVRTASMAPRPTNPNEAQKTPYESFLRLTYGGAGTAMPAFGPTVPEQTRWDLAFYLFANRFGPCERTLSPVRAGALATISDDTLAKTYGFGASACLRRSFF